MFTAAHAIAELDSALSKAGGSVTLRRGVPSTTLTVPASVHGYKPDELVGTIIQGDRQVVLSPTGLSGVFASTPPRRGDKVDIGPDTVTIEDAEILRIGSTIVRINLHVRGG
jgi:hypothetical protein